MGVYKACEEGCGGEIVVGMFDPITVPELGEDGQPVLERDGSVRKVTLRLPTHRFMGPHSRPDPTGFAPALCQHGLKEHPDPEIQKDFVLSKYAVTWIRAKYLDVRPGPGGIPVPVCPVCLGEEAPADMLTPRNAT
jgi:hypothetical protein